MDYFTRMTPNARIGMVVGICAVIAIVAYLIYTSVAKSSKTRAPSRSLPNELDPGITTTTSTPVSQQEAPMDEGYSEVDGNDLEESQKMMVLFHMSGCGPCGAFMPTWDEFTRRFNGLYGVHIVKINGPENREITNQFNVSGFPSVMFCPHGISNPSTAIEYTGNRSLADLEAFLKQHA